MIITEEKEILLTYKEEELEEVKQYIIDNYGDEEENKVFKESKSEFIKSDILFTKDPEYYVYSTLGMGAGKMNSPENVISNCEILFFLSLKSSSDTIEALCAMMELSFISKYPFRENTYFTEGHTLKLSKSAEDLFGFSHIIFLNTSDFLEVGDKKINFLLAVPMYVDEYEWISKRPDGAIKFLDLYLKMVDDDKCFLFDVTRKHIKEPIILK